MQYLQALRKYYWSLYSKRKLIKIASRNMSGKRIHLDLKSSPLVIRPPLMKRSLLLLV